MARNMPTVTGNALRYQGQGHEQIVPVGTPAWYAWLQTARAFTFRAPSGHFTARKEQSGNGRGSWYWKAYCRRGGKLCSAYLGKAERLSLERLQGAREEVVLEVIERAEEVTRRRTSLSGEQAELAGRRDEIAAHRDAAFAEIDEQAGKARDSRAAIAADLPADLLDLYDRLRAQHGVGAAALRNGRCEGCHLSLNTVDLGRIRAAPPDEVIRCEECRRILVREQNA